MSLESFYGGKQGISPVIKASFQYVDINDPAYGAAIQAKTPENGTIPTEEKAKIDAVTMDIVLADSNYEDVWYNELCIINTTNKANKNNGKLYRRTLKGRGDTGVNLCAEYIGQIVGPPGANPFMAFKSIDEVNTEIHKDYTVNEDTVISWPDGEDSISSIKPAKDVNPHVFSADTDNKIIVPGKDSDGNYNDNIRYTWFNIVDNTAEEETQSMVYLGFQIPYPSIDITTKEVDWDKSVESTKRSGDGYDTHPFYHSWDIKIPRGIRGNAASNIRLAKYEDFIYESNDESDKPFLYDYQKSVSSDGAGSFIISQTTMQSGETVSTAPGIFLNKENIPDDMPFWVYDYTFYDKTNTKTCTFYLGSYKEIKDINFDENGTITFIYSNATQTEFPQIAQWVKEISIDKSGLMTFTYNTLKENSEDNNTYSYQLPFPTSLNIDNEGRVIVSLKGAEQDSKLSLKKPNGEEDFLLNYVNTLSMDKDSKVLSYTTSPKNNGSTLNNGEGLNYLQATTIDERYHLMMYHASSQFRPVLKEEEVSEATYHYFDQYGNQFTQIINNDELSTRMQLKNLNDNTTILIWNDGLTYKNGIQYNKYIKTIDTSFDSNKIYYEFSDNKYIETEDESFQSDKIYYELYSIPATEYWQDLGLVRQISQGLRITEEFNLTTYPDYQTAFENKNYDYFLQEVLNQPVWGENIPNPYYDGSILSKKTTLEDPSLRGAVCYTPLVDNGTAYYYDYAENIWKYIGRWDTSGKIDICINEPVGGSQLSEYGITLKTRQTNESEISTTLPIFWEES